MERLSVAASFAVCLALVAAISIGSPACSGDVQRKPECVARDCAGMGVECGEVDDGAGGCFDCGGCVRPDRCGGGGVANMCGCSPATCLSAGAACGAMTEPCSGMTLQCGTCTAPGETCGGAGEDHQCGRTSKEGEACAPPANVCASGLSCCPDVCVPSGVGGACPGPTADLIVDPAIVTPSLALEWRTFTSTDCAVLDGCVQTGRRRLLRFTTQTPNVGTGDLSIGNPNDPPNNPDFVFSMCHVHYHYTGFMLYRLLASDGSEAGRGLKAAFCLEDARRWDTTDPTVAARARFLCNTGTDQGIQRGWADYYGAELDCQWVDVTDVGAGAYTLELTVNPDGRIAELRHDNNTATVAVTVTMP